MKKWLSVDPENFFQKNVTQNTFGDYRSDKHKDKNLKTDENDPKKFFQKKMSRNEYIEIIGITAEN